MPILNNSDFFDVPKPWRLGYAKESSSNISSSIFSLETVKLASTKPAIITALYLAPNWITEHLTNRDLFEEILWLMNPNPKAATTCLKSLYQPYPPEPLSLLPKKI